MSASRAGEGIWALAIHGGAGAARRHAGAEARAAEIRAALAAVLDAGARRLSAGGTALDAVEDAVVRLEDSPLFNAGRGAVLNERGEAELDASIMDGASLRAGAAAGLRTAKNPIRVVRLVLERSPHVLIAGDGAEAFAAHHGVERVDPAYFVTDRRRRELAEARRGAGRTSGGETGTVGAVALDVHGNLAAATSTGGVTNKAVGRVGDSAVIGAGTFASNASCAVSCTGQGEIFIRATAARDVAALMEYAGLGVEAAAVNVIRERVASLGGEGGLIAVDRHGHVAFSFNTDVMLRGAVTHESAPRVALDRAT
ncbi:MAG TPA: isoaspartyl peptidase/L-asparaginase [Gammaproteobacteria bacterium]